MNEQFDDNEKALVELVKHLYEMLGECAETKSSNELEIMLGDENMGDKLIVSVRYINAEQKVKKKKTKTTVILN